ncbi:hypothetical protein EVJ50_05525 [Synechococcus sp. RSCCF101]|uniref:hypothetical protein n=1 Tax=Synechococcus sp. RSCCF101 TaxID=2511069 RepID=UPI001244B5A5|nr:hypothetical protein [Synechococcus sp. RSCCF101]QEY31790.1 hypothetical protein EVJ50_05525 [Synechococcus sp. RSCCF101]
MTMDFPTQAQQALSDLREGRSPSGLTGEEAFSAFCQEAANWWLLLGEGSASARWRGWALLTPEPAALMAGLEALLQRLSETDATEGPGHTTGSSPGADALSAEAILQRLGAAERGRARFPGPHQLLQWAYRLAKAGEARAALATYLRVARDQDLPVAVCNAIGSLQEQLGDLWLAERWFLTSLSKQPQQVGVLCHLSRLRLRQGVWDEAWLAAAQAVQLNRELEWPRQLLSRCALESGGCRTLAWIEQQDLLPREPAHRKPVLAQRARLQRWPLTAPAAAPWPGAGLEQRLALHRRCRPARHLVLVHGRTLQALHWLLAEGLIETGTVIHPSASRDPLGVEQGLQALGLEAAPEQPLEALAGSLPDPFALVVCRHKHQAVHHALGQLLNRASYSFCHRSTIGADSQADVFSVNGYNLRSGRISSVASGDPHSSD